MPPTDKIPLSFIHQTKNISSHFFHNRKCPMIRIDFTNSLDVLSEKNVTSHTNLELLLLSNLLSSALR